MRRKNGKFRSERPAQARASKIDAAKEVSATAKPEAAADDKTLHAAQQRMSGAIEVFDMVLSRARKGDPAAANIILNRWETMPVAFRMRDIKSSKDATGARADVMRALADGKISISQAERILKFLAQWPQLPDDPSARPVPTIQVKFGREGGVHNGQFFAEQDRLAGRERRQSGQSAGEGAKPNSGAAEPQGPVGEVPTQTSEFIDDDFPGATTPPEREATVQNSEFIGGDPQPTKAVVDGTKATAEPAGESDDEWVLEDPGFLGETVMMWRHKVSGEWRRELPKKG